MNQTARAVKIALKYLAGRLRVEILQIMQHIFPIIRLSTFLHFQHSLQIPKAVKPQLLGKTHNRGRRHRTAFGQFVNGDMPGLCPVLDNIFIDDHIGIIQALPMFVDDFFQLHINPSIYALSIAKQQILRQVFASICS